MSSQAGSQASSKVQAVGLASPVFQMIGTVDAPDGAVCGIDGVCVVPEAAGAVVSAENAAKDSSSTMARSK